MAETGIWDSEEKRYVGNSEDFAEWRASRYPPGELRPTPSGRAEVAHWRLTSRSMTSVGESLLLSAISRRRSLAHAAPASAGPS